MQQVEEGRKLKDCHDCGAKPGDLHMPGCDTEVCPLCGCQAISCHCIYEVCGIDHETLEEKHPDIYAKGPTDEMAETFEKHVKSLGGRIPWSGEWPGVAECREYGFWCKWVTVPHYPDCRAQCMLIHGRWQTCDASDPEAREALNELHLKCDWSRTERRWVRRRTA